MPIIRVTATLTLDFDTEESFVQTAEQADEEMREYLFTGPNPSEFEYTVEVIPEGE